MKLEKIRIRNYRSILESESVILGDYSVLIGKNNEGKSNILNAISSAFLIFREFLTYLSFDGSTRIRYKRLYNFETDYPIDLQKNDQTFIYNNPTSLTLSFSINESDKRIFNKDTGLTYNGLLEVVLKLRIDRPEITVLRRRDDSKQTKTKIIINYILNNFGIIFIPTIRTSEQSIRIIEQIVGNGLNSLRFDSDYQKAFELIRNREMEKLDEISSKLTPIMKTFLPSISSVKIDRGPSSIRTFRRDMDFIIDDGNVTCIEYKGDGIKSLVQIALLKETSEMDTGLILIEEPESHLHPGAIHELSKILRDISKNQQIVVTTHNPIFVNSNCLKNNYIVNDRKCLPAKSIEEIRNVLGVHFSDSLFSSDCVILVEGESDKKVYSHLMSLVSPVFKHHFDAGTISFVVSKGATKSHSFISLMNQLLVRCFAIWDNDCEGVCALEKCKKSSLIEENYRLIPVLGKKAVVLEDLIRQDITIDYINDKYHCNINYNSGKSKWSDYIIRKLKELGLEINSDNLEQDKDAIADLILTKNSIDDIINVEPYKNFIKELAASILLYFDLD